MSTIEEAREQARKVVLDAAWAQFMRMPSSNPSDYAHAVIKALETRGQAPALLDATEPHERQAIYGGEEHVCATCPKNSYGYHVAWDQAHPEVPVIRHDEDEREALVNVIRLFFQNWRAIGRVSPSLEVSIDSLEGAVDDLIELDAPKDGDYHEGFEEGVKVGRAGSGPRPITDEMVEAARKGWQEAHGRTGPGTRMRAALEAAMAVNRG